MKEKLKAFDCGKYITIVNVKGDYNNHSHITKGHKKQMWKAAKTLINLVEKKRVPKSNYFRESALRLTRDKKYKEKIRVKIAKDKNRQRYNNRSGGQWS